MRLLAEQEIIPDSDGIPLDVFIEMFIFFWECDTKKREFEFIFSCNPPHQQIRGYQRIGSDLYIPSRSRFASTDIMLVTESMQVKSNDEGSE